ncbi:kelch domain-containing protein 4-like [Daphnia pulex]|uniref:kelch domain-containing protein 4-like n=1 Tax=Daphnia pulex TaxID=6669 RepID=UPI001EDD1BCE|nr:kelch domain-containing protein 4-like [Daphnia pulex]
MGKKDKSKKGKGAEKTIAKTLKKQTTKLKKELAAKGEEDLEQVIKELEEADRKKNAIVEDLLKDGPSRRANFSLNAHFEKDEIVMFGGEYFNGQKTYCFGDLVLYNLKKKTWLKIQAPGAAPPRCAHQAVLTAGEGGQLWIFGGEYASPSQSQFYHYKDLWVFYLKTKKWEKINATLGPSSRSGHRMVLCKKNLVVFGGYHDNGLDYKYYNDVHLFDLESRTWRKIEPSGTAPSPRSGCQMVTLPDGRILITGGYSKNKVKKDVDKGIIHSDAFLLFPDKHDTNGTKWKWQTVKLTGTKPSPRTGMSVVANTIGNRAYFFGGVHDEEEDEENISGSFFNDLYCLDLEKLNFNRIILDGVKAKKEASETEESTSAMPQEAEQAEPSELVEQPIVHDDGIFTLTIGPSSTTNAESAIAGASGTTAVNVTMPSPRMGSGLCVKHGQLYLYGGIVEDGDKQYTLNDMFALDLHKGVEWDELIHDEQAKSEWIDSDSESSGMDSDGSSDSNDDDEEESDEAMEEN